MDGRGIALVILGIIVLISLALLMRQLFWLIAVWALKRIVFDFLGGRERK